MIVLHRDGVTESRWQCRRRLGDELGGIAYDKKAASSGIDNCWTRLASERLAVSRNGPSQSSGESSE